MKLVDNQLNILVRRKMLSLFAITGTGINHPLNITIGTATEAVGAVNPSLFC